MADKQQMLSRGIAGILSPERNVKNVKVVRSEPIRMEPVTARRGRPRKEDAGLWAGKEDYYTSVVFDRSQYERVRELAYVRRWSVKETLWRLIESGLENIE